VLRAEKLREPEDGSARRSKGAGPTGHGERTEGESEHCREEASTGEEYQARGSRGKKQEPGCVPWEIKRREATLVTTDWGRGGMRLIPGSRSPAESDS
jgi:hypothetical protein